MRRCFCGADPEHRALRAEGRALAAGLDLDEDERPPVRRDDVELAEAGAGVALDDLQPAAARRSATKSSAVLPILWRASVIPI